MVDVVKPTCVVQSDPAWLFLFAAMFSPILCAADGLSAAHLCESSGGSTATAIVISRVRIHNTASPFASCFLFLHLHTASQRPLKIMKTIRPPRIVDYKSFLK